MRVNAVGPAFIDTPLLADADKEAVVSLHPQGRLGRAEEVAEVAMKSDWSSRCPHTT
ncbi:hypothetical protein GCM10023196_050020 [Actinoallomurus vinaceus]|uniref:Uncharacterized protein n=1 Tax=Actinoallomurus vinaceus TaxID=1080074 RepID=A0ABP8UFU5_9ACTN